MRITDRCRLLYCGMDSDNAASFIPGMEARVLHMIIW